ncbi:hypothetical protein KCG44_04620 [Pacificimonas sp. WHA3]|uniref:Glycosyltransferase RgtA/B/C/D-like domain-containing protein n=1 Tax=Pacificimonas pallii TaxID=2827236 RepID=A0ABS6SCV4_9SPHN|nr:hypothetical protein [Pacificimonas pallii]MBV7256065.1 hypothetical protein [Pacificimonas pallii]
MSAVIAKSVTETSARPPFALYIAIIWLFAALLSVWGAREPILGGQLVGPDDLMRIVQVRDFLAGQNWFDVSQHRMNTPWGAPMHWSRIVDLPLAAIIYVLTPVLGTEMAERTALVAVPLTTLFLVMLMAGLLIRRVAGPKYALLGVMFVPALVEIAQQLKPMRIDHHGWQILLGVTAVHALLLTRAGRAGLLAGAAMSMWMHISIEGLPYAVAIGIALAIRAALDPAETRRLLSYMSALTLCSALLFVGTQPSGLWQESWCDAMMPAYFAAFGASLLVMLPLANQALSDVRIRFAVLAAAGISGVGALAAVDPACTAGPFAQLTPFVRTFWYARVLEGQPLWHAAFGASLIPVVQISLGAAGYAYALRRRASPLPQRDLLTVAGLFLIATMIGLLVARTIAHAEILALPGTMILLGAALPRVRQLRRPARTFATIGVILMVFPITPLFGYAFYLKVTNSYAEQMQTAISSERCNSPANWRAVQALPVGRVYAPIDIAPTILALTDHGLVASGHHRNQAAMGEAMRGFVTGGDDARTLVERRGVTHVIWCEGLPEVERYVEKAPNGFMAKLRDGRAPDWLRPVPQDDVTPVRIYEVVR